MAQVDPQGNPIESKSQPKKVNFDYIKSNHFRVIHADGIFGGLSPSGDTINIGVWNHRHPFPKRTVQILKENGELGDELIDERVTRDAIVREMEANLVMDIDVAKSLVDWLNEKLVEAEQAKLRRSALERAEEE